MTYDQIPYDSRLPYEPRRVTMDDILDDQITFQVDHFQKCCVVNDGFLGLRTVSRFVTNLGEAILEKKRLVDEMRWQRLKLVASFQEAFWPLHQEEALTYLGRSLSGKVASLFNLIVCNSPFFRYSTYWGDAGERKYEESVKWMLENPEKDYSAYEMEFVIKGQEMPYTEDLYSKVRHFLSPIACKIFTSERWR